MICFSVCGVDEVSVMPCFASQYAGWLRNIHMIGPGRGAGSRTNPDRAGGVCSVSCRTLDQFLRTLAEGRYDTKAPIIIDFIIPISSPQACLALPIAPLHRLV